MTNFFAHRLDTLAELVDIVAERAAEADPANSYTAALLARGADHCARKFGEEAVEAVVAAVSGNREALTAEAADLLFHLLVLLRASDVPLSAVMNELARRKGTGGHAEKADRNKT